MTTNGKQITNKSNIRRERFVRIAEGRVNKIISNLDNLGKCSNKNNYEYSEEEVRKIFREIDRKVKEVKIQFQGASSTKGKFHL